MLPWCNTELGVENITTDRAPHTLLSRKSCDSHEPLFTTPTILPTQAEIQNESLCKSGEYSVLNFFYKL